MQPPTAATSAIMTFTKANGLEATIVSDMGEWVQFTTTVAHANTLFNANYQSFAYASTSTTLTRTLSYSLPSTLVGHVDTIIPTTTFEEPDTRLVPAQMTPEKRASIPASCNSTITPSCLQVRLAASLKADVRV
jgi:tripeptidyl-peptidase-1